MKKIKDYLLNVSTLDRSILYITLLIIIGIVGIVSYKNIYIHQSNVGLDSLLAEPVPGSPEYNYKYGYPSQYGVENLPETPPDYISQEEIENINISVKMDGKRFKQSLDGYPVTFTSSIDFSRLEQMAGGGFYVLLVSKACLDSGCYIPAQKEDWDMGPVSRWPDYAFHSYVEMPIPSDGKTKISHPQLRVALPEGEYVFIISLSLTGNRNYEGLLTDTVVKEIITEPFFLEKPIKKVDWTEYGGDVDQGLVDVSLGERMGAFTVSDFNIYSHDFKLEGVAQLTGRFFYTERGSRLCFMINQDDLNAPNLKEHTLQRSICYGPDQMIEKRNIEAATGINASDFMDGGSTMNFSKPYTIEVKDYYYLLFRQGSDRAQFLRIVP